MATDRPSRRTVVLLIAFAAVVAWLCWLTWTRTADGKAVPIFHDTEENRKAGRVGKAIVPENLPGRKDGR